MSRITGRGWLRILAGNLKGKTMYRNSITSSLSGEFPCHVAVDQPYDPLWDEGVIVYPSNKVNLLTIFEKASSIRLRLPAAGSTNVPLPTP